jgi:hypothetical protein
MPKDNGWTNGEVAHGNELAAFLRWLREESVLLVDNEEHNKLIVSYLKRKRRDEQEWLSVRVKAGSNA